ncbi:MAG TPA: hypothetical protein VF782_04780 [Allosphingosinicella sp.]|jgi:hypothetical protein
MDKDQFRLYFHKALDRAVASFEKVHGPLARKPDRFEVHAPGPKGRAVTETEAIDAIFLGESLFYKIIDVAVVERPDSQPIGFVRVSGHPPCSFEETLNPRDLGPFKSLEPLSGSGLTGYRAGTTP